MTARLPTPGGDDGDWGDILNAFLEVSLASDGTLNSNVVGTNQLQNNAVTNTQLDSTTQGIIASVANKYVLPGGGIPSTDLSNGVQTSLTAASTAVQIGGDLGGTTSVPTLNSTTNVESIITANSTVTANASKLTNLHIDVVTDWGFDATGATDFSSIAATKIAALQTAGIPALLYFPAGSYTGSFPTISKHNIGIRGADWTQVTINAPAGFTGAVVTFSPSPFPQNPWSGIEGVTIDGTNAGVGAIGILDENTTSTKMNLVCVQNFVGGGGSLTAYAAVTQGTRSTGIWRQAMDYLTAWDERWEGDYIKITNCTDFVVFDGGYSSTGKFAFTLSSSISSGSPITSIPINTYSGTTIPSGTVLLLNGSGTYYEQVTTTSAVSSGATAIPITSYTPKTTWNSGAQGALSTQGSFMYGEARMKFSTKNAGQRGLVFQNNANAGALEINLIANMVNGDGSNLDGLLWFSQNSQWVNAGDRIQAEFDPSQGNTQGCPWIVLDNTSIFHFFGRINIITSALGSGSATADAVVATNATLSVGGQIGTLPGKTSYHGYNPLSGYSTAAYAAFFEPYVQMNAYGMGINNAPTNTKALTIAQAFATITPISLTRYSSGSVDMFNQFDSTTKIGFGLDNYGRPYTNQSTSGTASPTYSVGAGAGSGATMSLAGNDIAGLVTLNLGASPILGALFTITFVTTRSTTPRVFVQAADSVSATILKNYGWYINGATDTAFTLSALNAPTSVASETCYIEYWVIG